MTKRTDRNAMGNARVMPHRLGFAVREPSFGGHITKPKSAFDDNLNAIAAPVMNGVKVLGCINIIWIRRLATQKEIARRHLDHLLRAAAEIGQHYSRIDRLSPAK
jgi:IclR family transcriptional regulator, mhp operon transcriptional activator